MYTLIRVRNTVIRLKCQIMDTDHGYCTDLDKTPDKRIKQSYFVNVGEIPEYGYELNPLSRRKWNASII
jgi:hypothetical protein